MVSPASNAGISSAEVKTDKRGKAFPIMVPILLLLWLGPCAGGVYLVGTIPSEWKYKQEYLSSARFAQKMGWECESYKQYEAYKEEKEHGAMIAWATGIISFVALIAYIVKSRAVSEYTSGVREYLKAIESHPKQQRDMQSRHIPSHVRREVWRRDQGRCVSCGGRHNLEYDHIIPVSKGGGNTARNIELLCEECNRRKSDKIV